jgi:hypothetical protein
MRVRSLRLSAASSASETIAVAGFGVRIVSLGEAGFVALEHRRHDVDALRLQLGLFRRTGDVDLDGADNFG